LSKVYLILIFLTSVVYSQNTRLKLDRSSDEPPDEIRVDVENYFREELNSNWSHANEIITIPGTHKKLLVSGRIRDAFDFFECDLFLLEKTDAGFTILSHTTGMGDVDWLTPLVFSGHQTTLILADVGSEYSLGLLAFVIEGQSIQSIEESPNVAVPTLSIGIGPPASTKSALPYVSAYLTESGFELEFNIDLVMHPGSSDQTLLCRSDSIIVMREIDGFWDIYGAQSLEIPYNIAPYQKCR